MTVKAQIMRIADEGIGVDFIDLAPHDDEIIRGWINLYCNTAPWPKGAATEPIE